MATKTPAPPADKGNAPGGPDFSSANGPQASGDNANLGDQVRPETQLREDDGNRTLAKPVTDPGPYIPEGGIPYKHPARGEKSGDVNEHLPIMQRVSTAPEWAMRDGVVVEAKMHPDLYATGAASDVYNPEKGEGLTDMAMARSGQERELAPALDTSTGKEAEVPAAA